MRAVITTFVVVGASALSVVPAFGQVTPEPKRVCFRGRPAAFCRAFWLTEGGYYRRLAGSDSVETSVRESVRRDHLSTHWSWEVGGMVNRWPSAAVGATVLFGLDGHGTRFGIKGRYRKWLDRSARTLDLSAGPLKAEVGGSYSDLSLAAHGATADASLGWGDLIATTVRADLLRRSDGKVVHAVYGGVRLGSYPAVVGTATAAVVIGTMIAIVFRGEY